MLLSTSTSLLAVLSKMTSWWHWWCPGYRLWPFSGGWAFHRQGCPLLHKDLSWQLLVWRDGWNWLETHLPSLKLCYSLVRSYIRCDTSGINSSLGWILCQAQTKFLHSPTRKKLLTVAEKLETSNVGIEKLEKEVLEETSLAVGTSTLRFVQDHLKLFPPWSCPGIKCSPYLLAILSNGKAGHSTGQFFIREVASSSHLLGTLLAWL